MSSSRVGFRQLNAASICRPWNPPWFGKPGPLLPVHPVMVWTDDEHAVGDELSVDVFPGDGTTLEFRGRVEWVQEMPDAEPARFRVGLRLSSTSAAHTAVLSRLLEP